MIKKFELMHLDDVQLSPTDSITVIQTTGALAHGARYKLNS